MSVTTSFETLKALKADGLTYKQVGAEVGRSAAFVHKVLKQGFLQSQPGARVVDRPHSRSEKDGPNAGAFSLYLFDLDDRKRARKAAAKRGLTTQQLWQSIVDLIAAENLFDAILDDGDDA